MAFRKVTADYGVDETLDKDGKVIRVVAITKVQLVAQMASGNTNVAALQAKLDVLAAE